jgi:hypothetical protein
LSNPTTPFNWQMPTATDLVTDLPADFEVFGQAVATSMADLLGGTTDQVLAKNSNTDMDFKWVTSDDANAIQNTIVDAKGDLIAATAADTPARLAVGTDNNFLQAASGQATGLQWGGTYTAYTPTTSGLTLGNGTISARYLRVGKMCHVEFRFTLGSTSAMGLGPQFSLPFNANQGAYGNAGGATLYDAGTAVLSGWPFIASANVCYIAAFGTSSTYMTETAISSTVPFTWTTGDELRTFLVYEVA